MGNFLCCAVVPESTVGAIETLGKYDRIVHPGFHCINCCVESVTHRTSLRLGTFSKKLETVTKDRISVTIMVGVQYKVNHENIMPIGASEIQSKKISPAQRKSKYLVDDDMPMAIDEIRLEMSPVRSRSIDSLEVLGESSKLMGKREVTSVTRGSYQSTHSLPPSYSPVGTTDTSIYKAIYLTSNPIGQMEQFIEAYFRGISCDYTMNELFVSKSELSDNLTSILNKEMNPYGYIIHRALISDIDPPKSVKEAMNLVSESVNQRAAKINQAEADKAAAILRAEANADIRRLEGEGIAKQREAIAQGFRNSVGIKDDDAIDSLKLMSVMLTTQYMDMLDKIGATGKNTIIMSAAPNAAQTIEEQMRMAILSTKAAAVIV